jgi:hypothetical protein
LKKKIKYKEEEAFDITMRDHREKASQACFVRDFGFLSPSTPDQRCEIFFFFTKLFVRLPLLYSSIFFSWKYILQSFCRGMPYQIFHIDDQAALLPGMNSSLLSDTSVPNFWSVRQ